MKIALAQINPSLGDVKRNLSAHLERIRQARSRKADLVVFPELSLTGYLLHDLVQDVALDLGRAAEIRKLAAASRDLGVLVGVAECTERFQYHNSSLLLEGGKRAFCHRKVYLPTYGMFDEGRYFGAGDRFRVHSSKRLGRLGVLICEDAWHLS